MTPKGLERTGPKKCYSCPPSDFHMGYDDKIPDLRWFWRPRWGSYHVFCVLFLPILHRKWRSWESPGSFKMRRLHNGSVFWTALAWNELWQILALWPLGWG